MTQAALAIVECDVCGRFATGGIPQPLWVGMGYQRGNPVLLLQNPGSSPLEDEAEDYLRALQQRKTVNAFLDWSLWRCADTETWKQWPPLRQALGGLFALHNVAWLNVSPFPTKDDKDPSAIPDPHAPRPWRKPKRPTQADHGRNVHLLPLLLEVLRPGAVITRYKSATLELAFLQEQLVTNDIRMPWPPTPSLNVPNTGPYQWDRESANQVVAELKRRYPARAKGAR